MIEAGQADDACAALQPRMEAVLRRTTRTLEDCTSEDFGGAGATRHNLGRPRPGTRRRCQARFSPQPHPAQPRRGRRGPHATQVVETPAAYERPCANLTSTATTATTTTCYDDYAEQSSRTRPTPYDSSSMRPTAASPDSTARPHEDAYDDGATSSTPATRRPTHDGGGV